MLSFKRKSLPEADAVSAPPARASVNLDTLLRSFNPRASVIDRESAEVRGLLDATRKASGRGVQAVATLRDTARAAEGITKVWRVRPSGRGRRSCARWHGSADATAMGHRIERVAGCGIETEDTPAIHAAVAAVAQIGGRPEVASHDGAISADHLFDAVCVALAMAGANAAQPTSRLCGLADGLFPPVQDAAMGPARRSHPESQPTAAAGTSSTTAPGSPRRATRVVRQPCRRNMAGDTFIVRQWAAPAISVNGRHWGGLRLAFKC